MPQSKHCRVAHPQPTLKQIEQVLEGLWGQLRARLWEDLAQASDAAQWAAQAAVPARCRPCAQELRGRRQRARQLATAPQQRWRLERQAPAAAAGPPWPLLSVDGAMVPLVGRQWTEVKTLALGAVTIERAAPINSRAQSPRAFGRPCDI